MEVNFKKMKISLPQIDENEMNNDSVLDTIELEDTKEFKPDEIYQQLFSNYNLEKTLEFDEGIDINEE